MQSRHNQIKVEQRRHCIKEVEGIDNIGIRINRNVDWYWYIRLGIVIFTGVPAHNYANSCQQNHEIVPKSCHVPQ